MRWRNRMTRRLQRVIIPALGGLWSDGQYQLRLECTTRHAVKIEAHSFRQSLLAGLRIITGGGRCRWACTRMVKRLETLDDSIFWSWMLNKPGDWSTTYVYWLAGWLVFSHFIETLRIWLSFFSFSRHSFSKLRTNWGEQSENGSLTESFLCCCFSPPSFRFTEHILLTAKSEKTKTNYKLILKSLEFIENNWFRGSIYNRRVMLQLCTWVRYHWLTITAVTLRLKVLSLPVLMSVLNRANVKLFDSFCSNTRVNKARQEKYKTTSRIQKTRNWTIDSNECITAYIH